MFLCLQMHPHVIFSYFKHLRAYVRPQKFSRNAKNQWFLALRSVRPLAAKKCHKQLIFPITDRYNTKKFNNSWYHMGGRMGGRHMNENSRQSRIFNLKLIFNHKYTSKSMGRPAIRPPLVASWFFLCISYYIYITFKKSEWYHIYSLVTIQSMLITKIIKFKFQIKFFIFVGKSLIIKF